MDDKKKPQNGTFTQVPNVFLDTCDLPETAQILYLRLLRKIGYKGGKFTGSIRELSKFVHMSRGTTDRMSKKLKEAELINIETNETQGAMVITLNTDRLWALNKRQYEAMDVPIWDTKMPDLSQFEPQLSQNGTQLSQIEPISSQIGTQTSSKSGTNTNKTSNNTLERKHGTNQEEPNVTDQQFSSSHSLIQSSLSIEFTEDEQLIYSLVEKKHISRLKRDKNHKECCAKLASEGVTTLEQIESLIQFCGLKPHLTGKELYLKNLVNELNGWLQTHRSEPTSTQQSSRPASGSTQPRASARISPEAKQRNLERLRQRAQAALAAENS